MNNKKNYIEAINNIKRTNWLLYRTPKEFIDQSPEVEEAPTEAYIADIIFDPFSDKNDVISIISNTTHNLSWGNLMAYILYLNNPNKIDNPLTDGNENFSPKKALVFKHILSERKITLDTKFYGLNLLDLAFLGYHDKNINQELKIYDWPFILDLIYYLTKNSTLEERQRNKIGNNLFKNAIPVLIGSMPIDEVQKQLNFLITTANELGYNVNDETSGIKVIIAEILEITNKNTDENEIEKSNPSIILDIIFSILKANNLEFNFNKYGEEIINMLETYIILLETQYNEEEDLINELKLKLQEIKIYIKLRYHPSFVNPDTREETSKILTEIERIIGFITRIGIFQKGLDYATEQTFFYYDCGYYCINNLYIVERLGKKYKNTNIHKVYQDVKEKTENSIIFFAKNLETVLISKHEILNFILYGITPSISNFDNLGKFVETPFPTNGSWYSQIAWLQIAIQDLHLTEEIQIEKLLDDPLTPPIIEASKSPIIGPIIPKERKPQ